MLLIVALVAVFAVPAHARPITPGKVHDRIVSRGLGNWVGVELSNGTEFAGRIVSVDYNSFGLQLHNDPAVTPVLYSDVVRLHTGWPHPHAGWIILVAGFGGSAAMAAIGFHEVHKNEQQMPALPAQPTQPIFP